MLYVQHHWFSVEEADAAWEHQVLDRPFKDLPQCLAAKTRYTPRWRVIAENIVAQASNKVITASDYPELDLTVVKSATLHFYKKLITEGYQIYIEPDTVLCDKSREGLEAVLTPADFKSLHLVSAYDADIRDFEYDDFRMFIQKYPHLDQAIGQRNGLTPSLKTGIEKVTSPRQQKSGVWRAIPPTECISLFRKMRSPEDMYAALQHAYSILDIYLASDNCVWSEERKTEILQEWKRVIAIVDSPDFFDMADTPSTFKRVATVISAAPITNGALSYWLGAVFDRIITVEPILKDEAVALCIRQCAPFGIEPFYTQQIDWLAYLGERSLGYWSTTFVSIYQRTVTYESDQWRPDLADLFSSWRTLDDQPNFRTADGFEASIAKMSFVLQTKYPEVWPVQEPEAFATLDPL